MPPPKSGFLTSEFFLHLVAIVAGSGAFWEFLQKYLPMAQAMLGTSGAGAALIPIATAFLGLMVLIAHTAAKYSAGRVALKSAAVTAGDAAAAAVDSPGKAAEVLGGAGKALTLLLVLALAGAPGRAFAGDADPVAPPPTAVDHALVKACTVDPDGTAVGHGVWLADAQAVREAQELERLRAENAQLHLEPQVTALKVAIGAAVVLAAGFAAGWYLHRP